MVQIVRGVYGHYINGRVVPKTKDSEPFTLTPEQEERLVKAGIAKYVNLPDAAPDDDGEGVPDEGGNTAPDVGGNNATDDGGETDAPIGFDEIPEDVVGIPEYSVESSAKELREIGKLCGLSFPATMSKADMVDALDKHIEENTVEGVTVDDDGEIVTDEDAPSFDAADAVVD